MASSLFKQTAAINIVRIKSQIKRSRIPRKLGKLIERQQARCERAFNHSLTITDWKSAPKSECASSPKSVSESASLTALVVGSANYAEQYPRLAQQNLSLMLSMHHRRTPRTEWEVAPTMRSELALHVVSCAHFGDQAAAHAVPLVFEAAATSEDVPSRLLNKEHGVECRVLRKGGYRSSRQLGAALDEFEPDAIITDCNAAHFGRCHGRSAWAKMMASADADTASWMVSALSGQKKAKRTVIAGGVHADYEALLTEYAFLCDLFSFSQIEMSPVLVNAIWPKKLCTKSTKLLKRSTRRSLSLRCQHVLSPYFRPHAHLLTQLRNAYLVHCVYGCVRQLQASRVAVLVQDAGALDFVSKLQSAHYAYRYKALFKAVDGEFVTMPSALSAPAADVMSVGVKLSEADWTRLHKLFGIKFVQFIEHEMQRAQALVRKK